MPLHLCCGCLQVFVMVADPQGMILDSKEYYAPIITPFEAHLAFAGGAEWTGDYHLDFAAVLVRLVMAKRQSDLSVSSRHHTARQPHWRRSEVVDLPSWYCSVPCKPDHSGAQQVRVPHAAWELRWRRPETLDLPPCCRRRRTTLSTPQVGAALRRSRASRCWMAATMQGRPPRVPMMGPLMRWLSDLRVPCSCMVSMVLPCGQHSPRRSPPPG